MTDFPYIIDRNIHCCLVHLTELSLVCNGEKCSMSKGSVWLRKKVRFFFFVIFFGGGGDVVLFFFFLESYRRKQQQ